MRDMGCVRPVARYCQVVQFTIAPLDDPEMNWT